VPEIVEVWADDVLLCFDGRIVEVFGFPGSESLRFHVKNLELSADGPDRKGRYSVHIEPATRGGGCVVTVPEEDWPAVAPFLDHVLAAMPVVEEAVE
jgi:hypothetical protein